MIMATRLRLANSPTIDPSHTSVCLVDGMRARPPIPESGRIDVAVRQQLDEKADLWRELHHRMKNGLQTVASLLSLQTRRIADPAAAERLHAAQQQVQSLASLHERLYRAEDAGNRDFSLPEYLKDLCSTVAASADAGRGPCLVHVDSDPLSMPVDKLTPFALLLTELVSNALKHGQRVDTGRALAVQVAFRGFRDEARLTVTDTGPGLPRDFDLEGSEGLGMRLVQGFVRRLGGKLTVEPAVPGARFTVAFPLEQEQPRLGTSEEAGGALVPFPQRVKEPPPSAKLDAAAAEPQTDASGVALLSLMPELAELGPGNVRLIAAAGIRIDVPRDAILFRMGDEAAHCDLVLDGSVLISAQHAGGVETVVDVIDALSVLNLEAVWGCGECATSARTVTPAKLIRIPAQRLRELTGADAQIAAFLMRTMASQQRKLVAQLADLKLCSAPQRLARYLLALPREPNGSDIRLTIDKRTLASRLGATPEHLSRAFAALRQHGVRTHGCRVMIDDLDGLADFAAPKQPCRGT